MADAGGEEEEEGDTLLRREPTPGLWDRGCWEETDPGGARGVVVLGAEGG